MSVTREIAAITDRIRERSKPSRETYLGRLDDAAGKSANRAMLSCGNLAHGFAVCAPSEKAALGGDRVPNLGIITSYNDMLSAHQPFETFPALIKQAAREAGGVAQVAGGVPAMCDGVTQGQPGMELSLFSRDVIAHVGGDRAVAQHVRRGGLSRRLRQDRAGAGDRGADLRPSAGGVHPGRADDHRPAQRREGEGPPALRRRQGRPRRAAGGGVEILSRPRHLHLLRHRQFQPDADGDHGPAHAGRLLRQSGHAAARRADPGGGRSARWRSPRSATNTRRSAA